MNRKRIVALAGLIFVLLSAPCAWPQSPAYQPIPNYTGTNAGQAFRAAVNDRFSGVQPITPKVAAITLETFDGLEVDGAVFYCSDCQQTSPCVSGGSGAWAYGTEGMWLCSAGSTTGELENISPNGILNPRSAQFNAAGNDLVTCNGTIATGSATLTHNCAPGTFAAGQGIEILGAGAADTAAAGTGTATPHCTSFGATISCASPTTYTYQIVFGDAAQARAAAGASFTCASAAGTLNEANWCALAWTPGSNDIDALIYRGGTLIAKVPASDGAFNDYGNGALGGIHPDDPASPPSVAQNAPFITQVTTVGISGTTYALAVPVTTGVSGALIFHNDTAAMQAWANALMAEAGQRGYCPGGDYYMTSPLVFSTGGAPNSGLENVIEGPAGRALGGCHLVYDGPTAFAAGSGICPAAGTYNPAVCAAAVIYTNGLNYSQFDNLDIDANATAPYGFQPDNSDGSHFSNGIIVKDSILQDIAPSVNSAAVSINHPSCSPWGVSDVTLAFDYIYGYGVPGSVKYGVTAQCSGNTKNFILDHDGFNGFQTAANFTGNGSIKIDNGSWGNQTVADVNSQYETLVWDSTEMEDDCITGSRLLTGGPGGATLTSLSKEDCSPADDFGIVYSGQLNLIGNELYNYRINTTSYFHVANPAMDGYVGGTPTGGGTFSMGNDFRYAPAGPPPFYDGIGGNWTANFATGYPGDEGLPVGLVSIGDQGSDSSANPLAMTPVFGNLGDVLMRSLSFAATMLTDAATVTVSWVNGHEQPLKLTMNTTIAFADVIPWTPIEMEICQDATGGHTLTWPTISWIGASAPTMTATANTCDWYSFIDDGTAVVDHGHSQNVQP